MVEKTKTPLGFQDGYLAQKVGIIGALALGAYLVLGYIIVLNGLIESWPQGEVGAEKLELSVLFMGISLPGGLGTRLLVVAALSGAVGALISSTHSLVSFLGNRGFVRSWMFWYVARPFIGMALGVTFYVFLRAGFLAPAEAGSTAINVHGVSAVAILAGMFARQAIDKLKESFETLFPSEANEERADKITKPKPVGK